MRCTPLTLLTLKHGHVSIYLGLILPFQSKIGILLLARTMSCT